MHLAFTGIMCNGRNMSKQGRPPKDKEDTQGDCLSVHLRADEKDDVRKAARAARLPMSTWAGKVITEAAKRALAAVGMS